MKSKLIAATIALCACSADTFATSVNDVTAGDGGADPVDDAGTAPSNDAAQPTLDANTPPLACDTAKPFGAPVLVAGLGSGPYKEGARLLPDEKTIFFSSNPSSSVSLYVGTRPDATSAFAGVTLVAGVPTNMGAFAPTLSADGLSLVYQEQQSNGAMVLLSTSRSSTSSAFATPASIASVNGANSTAQPYLRADRGELYFVSNRDDVKVLHLYRSTISGSTFAAPTRVAEIAMTTGERYPAVTPDALAIYFSSTTGTVLGGADVYVARRTSTSDPFGAPQPVSELDSAQDDDVSWVSPDECTIYVRRGNATVGSIYVATR